MNLEIAKLLLDFGLMILIWLVQLIIYPGFSYYQKNNLIQWHKQYTQRLAYIVMPLMVGQLCLSVIGIFNKFSVLKAIDLVLIITVWLSTFLQFVPLHYKISSNLINDKDLKHLVLRNWLRTILWTLIFILGVIAMQ